MTPAPMTTEREDEAQMRKPFPSHGDAMTDERLHNRANELLKSKKHSLKVADRFAMTAECQAVIRDMLIEALAIGANDYASPAPTGAGEAEKREQVADAIDAARYAHPTHPRDRERPFAEADRSDREYAFRLADAAIAALRRAQPPQQTGMSKDWCMATADLEGDAEIGAGAIDHPLRAQPTGALPKIDSEGLRAAAREGHARVSSASRVSLTQHPTGARVAPDLRFDSREQPMSLIRAMCELTHLPVAVRELLVKLANEVDDLRRAPHPTGDVGGPTPDDVGREKDRILRLFVPALGDKEDLLSYAKEVVALRSANSRLAALTQDRDAQLETLGKTIMELPGHLRAADPSPGVKALRARVAELGKALGPFAALGGKKDGVCAAYHDLPSDTVIYENSGSVITAGDVRSARAALSTGV